MKKALAIILALCAMFSLVACGGSTQTPAGTAEIPNPITEMTAQELMNKTGLGFTVPDGAAEVVYSYIDTGSDAPGIAQMSFTMYDTRCTARVCPSDIPGDTLPDISGLYYQWKNTEKSPLGYNEATLCWNEGEQGYVSWYDYAPGLLYSVSMESGATKAALMDIAERSCPPVQREVGDGTDIDNNTPAFENASIYKETELPVTVNLNGDGKNETISMLIEAGDPYFGAHTFVLTDGDGIEHKVETLIQSNSSVCIADIDNDSRFEILLSGDCGSDDYITYAWRLTDDLETIPFTGEVRHWAISDKILYVDGAVESVDRAEDGTVSVTLGSFTYMLGTYGSTRPYTMADDGSLVPEKGTLWCFGGNQIWLVTAAEIPATLDGVGAASLASGTKIKLTGTNGTDTAYFVTGDSKTGQLSVSYDESKGAWFIGAVNENDAFVTLPYAG